MQATRYRHGLRILRRVTAGDPASYLTLEAGTDVLTADGRRIGVVEHVLRDEEADIFDGIVIDTTLGPGGRRFVDAPEVAEVRTDAVVLALSAADAERLAAPERNPGVMEHHGEEDSESPLERKLRRAWELVSGKGLR
jgi:uncharacterized protein YrrD